MITKTPKFLYFLLIVVLVIAADTWRRTWLENDASVSQEISLLRRNIIEMKRDVEKFKNLLLVQQTIISNLKQQLNEINKLTAEKSEKTPASIPKELLEKPEIEIKKTVENNPASNNLSETDFPDISDLASTNVILKTNEKKKNLSLPKRVTSVPAHTAVPEVSIPNKNPDLTSKTIDKKYEKNEEKSPDKILSGNKRGVRMTMSDILESYEDNDNKNEN